MSENGGLAGQGGPRRPPWARFLFLRSVQLVTAFWVLATIAVFLIVGDGELPFGERPSLEGVLLAGQVINGWATLGIALILIGVTFLITRGRAVPDMAARAPEKTVALAETAALVGYGVLVQLGGLLLGRALGDHAISLHMHGTLYGTENPLSPREAVVWMLYNFIFYAVLPYLYFRSRGYSNEQLNLRSSNRANDALLILVILLLESAIELSLVSSAIFGLDASQLLIGVPLILSPEPLRHGASDHDLHLRHPLSPLPQAHWLGCGDGRPRGGHLRHDPPPRLLDDLRYADQRDALGDLPNVSVLRPRHDQVGPNLEDG